MSHTKGPWHFAGEGLLINDDDVEIPLSLLFPDDIATPEAFANANLIAAAPELLEMTETLLEVIESLQRAAIKYVESDGVFNLQEAKANVERVLKRAKGGLF